MPRDTLQTEAERRRGVPEESGQAGCPCQPLPGWGSCQKRPSSGRSGERVQGSLAPLPQQYLIKNLNNKHTSSSRKSKKVQIFFPWCPSDFWSYHIGFPLWRPALRCLWHLAHSWHWDGFVSRCPFEKTSRLCFFSECNDLHHSGNSLERAGWFLKPSRWRSPTLLSTRHLPFKETQAASHLMEESRGWKPSYSCLLLLSFRSRLRAHIFRRRKIVLDGWDFPG